MIDTHLGEKNIDLMKVDIEGHELSALQGLRAEHWKQIQSLIMEVHPQHVEGVLDLFRQNNFDVLSRESALLHGEEIPEILIARQRTKNRNQ